MPNDFDLAWLATPSDAEMQDERVDRSIDWLKAVWALLSTWDGDNNGPVWFGLFLKAACLAAMLLGRSGIDDDRNLPVAKRWYHGIEMGFWDHTMLYAGWSCTTLEFHLRQFRYEIESDGDWSM